MADTLRALNRELHRELHGEPGREFAAPDAG
jgi:hypothetical protein